MALLHDIIRHAGSIHAIRGRKIDREEEQQNLKEYYGNLGVKEKHILESLHAIAPLNLCTARGVWWMNLVHPVKLCILTERIVYVRRFLFFPHLFRCERAVMLRHIREVEIDEYFFSARLIFRTHRSVEVFCIDKLYKKHAHQATRVIQALIHDELNHGSISSGDDFT
jgi:hypothetical protein